MNALFILFPLILVAGEIVAHRWIKKVTNMYWFWLGISVAYLIYVIAVAWVPHWNQYAHMVFVPGEKWLQSGESKIISDIFLLNICPFMNFALPICLIADPSRKSARGFAPLAIIGSVFVLFLDTPFFSTWTERTWQFIFLGNKGQNDLYFMGHLINLLMAIGVLLNTPKFGWKGGVISFGQIGGFYLYVAIAKTITRCNFFTSGLSVGDYTSDGNYGIFESLGIGMPWAPIIFFVGLITLIAGIILLFDFCKRNHYKYGNKPSDCWWQWYEYDKFIYTNFWGNNKNFALNRNDCIWTKAK